MPHMASYVKRFLRQLGPGFITGASDDDPSGIATYSQVGAQFGLSQLWCAFLLLPFMISIQEMVGRIGMVAGEGLTAVIRRHYSKKILWGVVVLVFIANTINIGADIGAMADATRLLVPQLPFGIAAVGYCIIILCLEIFLSYKTYANILKWLAFSLLSYVATAFIVTTNWRDVLQHAFIPTIVLNRDFILGLIAVAGTTITPYCFFWQSNEEVEEEVAQGRTTLAARRGATAQEIHGMRTDVGIGMMFSNLITFFIITTAAMTFFKHGIHNLETSAQAAQALAPLAGNFASLLFAIGIIGTGLLAVPILSASASYAIAEACQWSNGLSKKLRQAQGFYGAITIATVIGLLINFIGIPPIKALFWSAVVNGLIAPLLILIILLIANTRKILGNHVNGVLENIFGMSTFVLMTIAGVLLFIL